MKKSFRLFFKDEINGQDKEHKTNQVVPPERFIFEKQQRKSNKNHQRNNLLNNLKLNQRKRATIRFEPDSVGRNLQQVLKKSNTPTDEDNGKQRQALAPLHFLKLQVAVPGQRHKCVGKNE